MAPTAAIPSDTSIADHLDLTARDIATTMSIDDAARALGIPVAGAVALAEAGFFGDCATARRLPTHHFDNLVERLWRSALPAASHAHGVDLIVAMESAGQSSLAWPIVIAALLKGRVTAYRRRGFITGPVLSALVVSSGRAVSEAAVFAALDADAPFIWMPAAAH